jgi:hypothetical protein
MTKNENENENESFMTRQTIGCNLQGSRKKRRLPNNLGANFFLINMPH